MVTCKICYENLEEVPKYYCNCRGSLGIVHEKCLIEWIKLGHDSCEICKKEFSYRYKYSMCRENIIKYVTVSSFIYFLILLLYVFSRPYKQDDNIYSSFKVIIIIFYCIGFSIFMNKILNYIKKCNKLIIEGIVIEDIYDDQSQISIISDDSQSNNSHNSIESDILESSNISQISDYNSSSHLLLSQSI